MKKIFAISLIIFTLTSSVGVKLVHHYCVSELENETFLFESEDSCADNSDCCASENTNDNSDCCNEEQSFFFVQLGYFQSEDQLNFAQNEFSIDKPIFYHIQPFIEVKRIAKVYKIRDIPPPKSRSGKIILIQNQVFRI